MCRRLFSSFGYRNDGCLARFPWSNSVFIFILTLNGILLAAVTSETNHSGVFWCDVHQWFNGVASVCVFFIENENRNIFIFCITSVHNERLESHSLPQTKTQYAVRNTNECVSLSCMCLRADRCDRMQDKWRMHEVSGHIDKSPLKYDSIT